MYEKTEDLQYKGLKIYQPQDARFSCDAVLLSSMVRLRRGLKIVELGTGTGVIALLLAAREPGAQLTALEIVPHMAELAKKNVRLNGLQKQIDVKELDIKQAAKVLGYGAFDAAVANPPYFSAGAGTDARTAARHETLITLQEVCDNAAKLVKNGGHFYLVYPAGGMAALFAALNEAGFVPKAARLVQHSHRHAPSLVLVDAVLRGGAGMLWQSTLMLYDDEGKPTPQMKEIYHMEE